MEPTAPVAVDPLEQGAKAIIADHVSQAEAIAEYGRNVAKVEAERIQAEKDLHRPPAFRTRQDAHRYLVGQMRGSGKLARKAKRRLAVAMVKRSVHAQKRQA